jgi:predicted membrane metal-binding protein
MMDSVSQWNSTFKIFWTIVLCSDPLWSIHLHLFILLGIRLSLILVKLGIHLSFIILLVVHLGVAFLKTETQDTE